MTRVVAVRREVTRSFDVYVMSDDGRFYLRDINENSSGDMNGEWVETVRGTQPPPVFSLPDHIAGPLAAALANTIPPNSSMQRHLDDAVKVRDVLLDLVAKVVRDGV